MHSHIGQPLRRMLVPALTAALVAGSGGAAAIAVPAAALAQPNTAAVASLKKDLDKILTDQRLAKAVVGVEVRDPKTGAKLYSRGSDALVSPASNMKLFTATAALDLLGPGHRFTTTISTSGRRQGSTVHGDLHIKGTGDPTIQDADYAAIAKKIAAAGIKKVDGKLIVDDTWFDNQYYNPAWDPTDAPFAYGAQISALTVAANSVYDTGAVSIKVAPAAEGKPVTTEVTPKTTYVTVENKAVTGKAGSPSTLQIDRPKGTNKLVVTGSAPAGGAALTKLRTVDDPALYAGDRLRAGLTASGVTVAGKTAHGTVGKDAKVVTKRSSQQLSKLMVPFMKLSNNGIADILTKAIGRKVAGKGSWAAGGKAITAHAAKLGVNTKGYQLVDGSGLADPNQVTAGGVSTLLTKVRTKTWFPAFNAALPVAGKDGQLVGGTLASRMKNTPAAGNVRAKTGSLTIASSLSGYVTDPAKSKLVFSIIFNKFRTDQATPTDLQDAIAIRLAGGAMPTHKVEQRRSVQQGKIDGPKEQKLECSWTRTC